MASDRDLRHKNEMGAGNSLHSAFYKTRFYGRRADLSRISAYDSRRHVVQGAQYAADYGRAFFMRTVFPEVGHAGISFIIEDKLNVQTNLKQNEIQRRIFGLNRKEYE